MTEMFVPLVEPPDGHAPTTATGRWFVVRDGDVLVRADLTEPNNPTTADDLGASWLPTRDERLDRLGCQWKRRCQHTRGSRCRMFRCR